MARMQIDLGDVRTAAKRASSAASELEKYADRIDKKVSGPLTQLSGGSSNYTNTAQSLASQKAKSLRKRATRYHKLSQDLQKLATHAEDADKDVYNKFNAMYKSNYERLSVWKKFGATVYRLFNNAVGCSKIGKLMMTGVDIMRVGAAGVHSALQWAARWFQYGNGRYVLEILVGVAAAVVAVLAICNPVGGIIATIAAVASVIAAIYAVGKAIFATIDAVDAMNTSSTDPGLARYKGGTKSFLDFAKKHFNHDKKAQNIFAAMDVIGITAGIVKTGCDFFKAPPLDSSVKGPDTYKFSWENFKYNCKSAIGFDVKREGTTLVKDDKGRYAYEWKGLKKFVEKGFGWKEVTGKGGTGVPDTGLEAARKVAKDTSIVTKEFQSVTKFVNGESSWSDVGKYTAKHVPGAKDIYSPIKDFGDMGDAFSSFPSKAVTPSSGSLSAASLNAISPNGGTVIADSVGHAARNLTSSGFTTGVTTPRVDTNVFGKVSSGLLGASRVTTLPDVAYTNMGNINTGTAIPRQFGTAGNLLPATSVTMDRAVFRAAVGIAGAAGVAKASSSR